MTEKLDWLAYAVTGKEFVAMDDLAAAGIEHWRGTRIEFERRGKNRTAEPYEYPALLNYIWIRPTHQQVQYLSGVRFLGGTFHMMSRRAVKQFQRFRDVVDAKCDHARRIEGNRKAIADYAGFETGEMIEIREGLMAGEFAKFKALVQGAHDLFPRVKAEMEVMGRSVMIELDPLSVRRAASA